jgi:preprotein translocase subunit SecF
MAAGVFSSVFIAPRILVHLKSSEADIMLSDKRAQTRVKHDADRYAAVPVFTEDMPVADVVGDEGESVADAPVSHTVITTRTTPPPAAGSGRIAPQARGPVQKSPSSGRQQPTRQAKSKRDKK